MVLLVQLGLLCALTHTQAFQDFASMFLNMGKETSGSGQDEEVLSPHLLSEYEALRALQLEPCPDGYGIACEGNGECFASLEQVCQGEMVCGMDVFCDTQEDPESCRRNYISTACQHDKAVHWLTTYGAPNFEGIDRSYDLQIFFDLWLFEDAEFCTDGRIKCHNECLMLDELCDASKRHCKCNGRTISRIISEYRMLQAFLGIPSDGKSDDISGMFLKENSLYSLH